MSDYERILAELREKRVQLGIAIQAIEALAGTTSPAGGTTPVARDPTPGKGKATPVKGATARPTAALSEVAIRTALKNDETTPSGIAAAANLPVWQVNRDLKRMRARGVVKKTGRQRSARYFLA